MNPASDPVTRAVILAAGRGTRMRELTDDVPKPMVLVAGRPVLERIVAGLASTGIDQILVVVGYHKEVIMDHFSDGSQFGIRIQYVEQVTQDGTGRVVALARTFAGNMPFLLSYGDILVNPSFYPRLLQLGDAETLLSVRRSADVSKGGAVFLNSAMEVTDLKEKPKPGEAATPWYNAGIYTFRESIFSYVAQLQPSPRGEYELTDAIRAMAHAGVKVRAVEITGDWVDVRDPEVLAEVNRRYAQSRREPF
jgi:UDP-N-acetylglucosamine diphosphorylase / glucose-1-phosphate thymidylyltransferase / UDP-N-acetylgalactosamine diphosphorylase / glucosamine-1-phosphate N-acetyltransferase / galactosamine-1-phosphate N-acetyltransferase